MFAKHYTLAGSLLVLLLLLFANTAKGYGQDTPIPISNEDIELHVPEIIIKGIDYPIQLELKRKDLSEYYALHPLPVNFNNKVHRILFKGGKASITHRFKKKESLNITIGEFQYHKKVNPIPLWCSILPPLIAILMALVFKEVFSALFVGLFSGTFIIAAYQDISLVAAFFKAIFAISDTYVIRSLADTGHISIIVFSMLIGAMVNLITQNGGMQGIVNKLAKYANSPRSGQFITWLLGVLIFFDDYANTLVVGNTMRPVTDRLKVSREKLAYIVDSTAAPVASVAMITTWIGIELSYIQSATVQIGITESPYSIFLHSLPSRFYPFFTLFFILVLVWKKRDFGAMYLAEQKARKGADQEKDSIHPIQNNELKIPADRPTRWYNAAIPVLIVILGTFAGLIYTGWNAETWHNDAIPFSTKLSQIIGASDSYLALLWSSLSAVLVAVALTLSQRLLDLKHTVESLISGFKTMLTAILILVLAWALADITKDMHTADFISRGLIATEVSPYLLPTFTFILSALIAFSTGSSWGTMAILYPLILPASWALSHSAGMDDAAAMNIFYIVVSAILAGSVLGDHCSPISDTTILSSLASSCNHIEHVRTQMPYALTVGSVSIAAGLIPAAYGVSSWILIPVGFTLLYLIVRFVGRTTE
ncbi:MAG: Na+/H+ antiporter NhaC family protein [Marinifilaceae bacterium]